MAFQDDVISSRYSRSIPYNKDYISIKLMTKFRYTYQVSLARLKVVIAKMKINDVVLFVCVNSYDIAFPMQTWIFH